MAARLSRVLLAAPLCVLLGAGAASAGLPPGAGIARAIAGQWAGALDHLDAVPPARRDRAEQYFHAAALLRMGLRGAGLDALRTLSESEGSFSGPALELAAQILFEEGRYAAVVEWAAASRAEHFQDPDSLHYRVGQSQLLLGHPEAARQSLVRVNGGVLLPYALHSHALLEIGSRRFGSAVDLLGEAIAAAETVADPEVAGALADALRVDRGRVLYQLAANTSDLSEGERVDLAELAREQFERVPQDSVFYPEALRGIGWCALETGDSSRSLASFAAAGAMDPVGRPDDLWAQGRVFQTLGYYDEAARLYREAGEEAGETAASLLGKEPGLTTAPVPAAARWERRAHRAAALEEGRETLDARLAALGEAAAARDRRLERAARLIETRRRRVSELEGELATLTVELQELLDQIPAAALFPPAVRGRVRSLVALQDRLSNDMIRIENALGAIGNTVFWTQAGPERKARGHALWDRLGQAKQELGDLQLGFLLALKKQVSQRETELARRIEQLRQGSRELADPLAAAEQARLGAVSRRAALGERLTTLQGRVAALRQPLGELRQVAREGVARAGAAAREEQAAQLRLRADAYALDEAQALHLLQEPPR